MLNNPLKFIYPDGQDGELVIESHILKLGKNTPYWSPCDNYLTLAKEGEIYKSSEVPPPGTAYKLKLRCLRMSEKASSFFIQLFEKGELNLRMLIFRLWIIGNRIY